MAGRRPVPDNLKDLTGSKQPRNPAAPRYYRYRDAESVPMIKYVSRDPEALEEWTRVLPEVVENGTLTRANLSLFGAYCQAYANWRHFENSIFDDGAVISVPVFDKKTHVRTGDRPVDNSAVTQALHWMQAMLRIAVEFGLTPAAATRVHAEPTEERKSDFNEFVEHEAESPKDEASGHGPN